LELPNAELLIRLYSRTKFNREIDIIIA
jgi:hypothetical protein